ncbi:signal peptide peptidase SppA [Pseudolabrys taiwanensis]|uniref:Signal peptide peptidase SppA n=1 Tax=Pseudolabrys taiwanensis TaxID=331696 RepID=A0A345ZZK0_9HYPH|nr:signal peptide peptidase SppA [Pseudolabrys taiwanensis]AXK82347.1 signal peptide peptidase SppA [Pseudolabrys taiwanensis]
MSLDADAIVDRRRLRRKLTFWRVGAVLIALIAIVGVALLALPATRIGANPNYVARIKIQGLIRNNQERVEALTRLSRSNARAVIVHIDSPGGTTAGSEQLYDALRDLQARKPMVVVVDGLAASGAYIAALSAEHIIAQDTSLVGSIGVLFQYPNFTDVMKTIGIKMEEVKSSPLKAAPNGFEPTSPEARAAIAAIVSDSYDWFKGLVKDRRKMDDAQLASVSDGRVFTGRQAVGLKLVDALGNEKAARAWLAQAKNIPVSTPVRDYALTPRFSDFSFLHLAAWSLDNVGLNAVARAIEQWGGSEAVERLNLDGLLALWHPPTSN